MNNTLAAQCALLAATLAIAALTTSVAPAQSAPEGGPVIIGTIEPQGKTRNGTMALSSGPRQRRVRLYVKSSVTK